MISFIKSLPTQTSDVSRRTRVGSWRISGSNQGRVFGNHEFNFGALDGSLMVATRSQRSPSADLARFGVESKRVLSLNLQNFFPAKFKSTNRILNNDAFITDEKTRSMDNEVNKGSEDCCGGKCDCDVFEISSPEGLKNSSTQERVADVCNNDRRLWSEEFGITHRVTVLAIEDLHG